MSARIEIVPYQPGWPAEAERVTAQLRGALGPLALRVEHIGSTAVPGLDAKDVIDVQVSVRSLDPAPLDAALASVGFTRVLEIGCDHRPPGRDGDPDEEWAKRYYRPPAGHRPTNLHVRQAGRANERYAILFRDYLRATPAAAEAYARIKRALAAQHPEDIVAYLDVKDPVCDLIMLNAEAWARLDAASG